MKISSSIRAIDFCYTTSDPYIAEIWEKKKKYNIERIDVTKFLFFFFNFLLEQLQLRG